MSDFDKTNLPDGSGEEDLTADLMAVASHSRGSKKSRKAVGVDEPQTQEAPAQEQEQASTSETSSTYAERRGRRRAMISAPVRVRRINATETGPDEVSTTLDVSRSGILFISMQGAFVVGMEVAVTFPYSKSPVAIQAEQTGRVSRISQMPGGRLSVAVALHLSTRNVVADASGRKLTDKSGWASYTPEGASKPLVLAVDADAALRHSLKSYLSNEGYEVIAVSSAHEAHEVLESHTPDLVIAEIEGDDLPGYDLCAHVKATPRLQKVPVMLMTRSAYPSDYSNAHSLGAVVCMAKPFRQERLGHVVRLLAPPPQANDEAAPRQGDPSRRTYGGNAPKGPKGTNAARNLIRKGFGLSR